MRGQCESLVISNSAVARPLTNVSIRTITTLHTGEDDAYADSKYIVLLCLKVVFVFGENTFPFAEMDYTTRMLSSPPDNVHSAVKPSASNLLIFVLMSAPRY